MGKFNIGSFAASLNETVSKLDTSAEPQLQYIDIEQLDAHEANFYEVSNLDTLADSIAMDGLQQPLVVTAGKDGRYTVISGHRRRAAIRKLVEEDGREDLRRVPCLVKTYQSPALAELQLIMANSTARVLSSAEVMHQAKRMEDLLYQLKEEGYSFPGRMRDQVAEACQVSASKLARLKVIRDKLIEPWMDRFEAGEVSEAVAYTIAQMGQDYQISLDKIFSEPRCYGLTKNTVEGYRLRLDEIAAIECAHGSACTNRERMIEHTAKQAPPYFGHCKTCCASCNSRSTCEHVCPMVQEQVAQEAQARQLELEEERAKREEREAKAVEDDESAEAQSSHAADAAEWEEEELSFYATNRHRWKRLGQEMERVGVSRDELASMIMTTDTDTLGQLLDGTFPYGKHVWDFTDEMAYAYGVYDDLAEHGVSIDYVLTGKKPEESAQQAPEWLPLQWIPGKERPTRLLNAACVFGCSERTAIKDVATWDGVQWIDCMGEPWALPCLRWFPIPDDEGENNEE